MLRVWSVDLMPLLAKEEVLSRKLKSMAKADLQEFGEFFKIVGTQSASNLIERLLGVSTAVESRIDKFIKQKFEEKILQRRELIPDEDLKLELSKVRTFSWGVVQGQLDQKIQTGYVRKFSKYDELIKQVRATLHDEITSYVICTWFNHWTTVLIEDHIGLHPRVVPTLKKIKGTDIFFDGQPFDLKVTYLPNDYGVQKAIKDPKGLAIWMYENQGAQRFGSDNRLFVVLVNKESPDKSWELKRDFDFVFKRIDEFFDKEAVSRTAVPFPLAHPNMP